MSRRRYLKEIGAYALALVVLVGLVKLTLSLKPQTLGRQVSNIGLLVWLIVIGIWTWTILQPVRDWITRNGSGTP